jgi:acyl carrier protein
MNEIKIYIYNKIKKNTKVKFNDETLIKNLKIDSLDLMELIIDGEEKFDVLINDDDLEKITKVEDIIIVIKKAKKTKKPKK